MERINEILEGLRHTGLCSDEELYYLVDFSRKDRSITSRVLENGKKAEVLEFLDSFYCKANIGGTVYAKIPYLTFLLWDFNEINGTVKCKDMKVGYYRTGKYSSGVIIRGECKSYSDKCDAITDTGILCLNWTYDGFRYTRFKYFTFWSLDKECNAVDLSVVSEKALGILGTVLVIKGESLSITGFNKDLSKFTVTYKGEIHEFSLNNIKDRHCNGRSLLDYYGENAIKLEESTVKANHEEISIKDECKLNEDITVYEPDYSECSDNTIKLSDINLGQLITLKHGSTAVVTQKIVENDLVNCITDNGLLKTISVNEIACKVVLE